MMVGKTMVHERYAWLIFVAGLSVTAAAWLYFPPSLNLGVAALAVISLALIAFLNVVPMKLSLQAETSLAAGPMFAGVLLLSPPLAALAAAGGSMIAGIRARRRPGVLAFHSGVSLLAASLAGMVFHGLVRDPGTSLLQPGVLAAGLLAGLILLIINRGAVAGMVSILKGVSFRSVWRETWTQNAVQEGGVVWLGYLGGILLQEAWWSVILLIVPLVLAYTALSRSVKEASENIRLAQELEAQMVELRSTQARLVQSAKMASIGTLAAGVAHEINNPLFVVMGRAELLLRNKEKHLRSESARQYLTTIHEQGTRAAQIVKDLLSFSRDTSAVEEVSMSDMLDKAASLAGKVLIARTDVQIKREYASNLPPISVAPNKLQQVFLNLLQNAKDAMPNGGIIFLRCWTENGRVCASIRDTGQGMTKEVLGRVFEPFYTTKEVGKGTGIGLFICHKILAEHNGTIRIESELGNGTEVFIELPALSSIREHATAPTMVQ
ncbi:MAG: Sensor kinase CckA [Dehalococcoidia bacterium]|nr:Sensor kinase CckA [Dehalococcoidia bacterium]